jgi:IclR family transcriptional regulator, acetate operon repressor
MSTSGGEGRPSVVDRVFCVLDSCAGSPRALTLVDLVERTGLPKTTLHRVCWKLVELGMLSHADDGFRIGAKLFAMGSMNPDLRRLRAAAMPHLHELVGRTGWATNLAVAVDDRVLVVEEVYSERMSAMPRMVGARLPLHATALGKALLAGYPASELDALLARGLRPYTPTTIVRPNLLCDQLAGIRASSVAFSHEEWSPGTSGAASPVVVAGRVVAAVAAVGPSTEPGLRERGAYVRVAAARLSQALSPAATVIAA